MGRRLSFLSIPSLGPTPEREGVFAVVSARCLVALVCHVCWPSPTVIPAHPCISCPGFAAQNLFFCSDFRLPLAVLPMGDFAVFDYPVPQALLPVA